MYTTDTIIDNPGVTIVYKGLVIYATSNLSECEDCSRSDILAKKADEAIQGIKKKAKKVDANAIVGMKIVETYNSKSGKVEVTIVGTAVHFSKGRRQNPNY